MIFERKIFQEMLKWKEQYAPHYALFLKGARRVGKTTLAEKLGREAYESYILIRFDQADQVVKDLFVNGLRDLDGFFAQLQFEYRTQLHRRKSLIILDEIQLFPQARQALKTLLEDGRYDYLETGSLAGMTKRSKDILIPSEEYSLEVHLLDFEEFLWARADTFTMPLMREHFDSKKPMGALHQSMMRSFREYMLVGGMPQVVQAFTNGKDYGAADSEKQRILSFWQDGMREQSKENCDYLQAFFAQIPSELMRRNKRYVISHATPNARWREYEKPIHWLEASMMIDRVCALENIDGTDDFAVADSVFRCYLSDTGLLVSLAFSDRPYLENELYRAVLRDQLQVNEGMLVENVVAQCLKANGHRAYFYVERHPETRKTTMEIDFLIRQGKKIVPIEVKSSGSSSIKSLLRFKEKFGKRIGEAIVLHHGEIKRQDDVWYLPYYMATLL